MIELSDDILICIFDYLSYEERILASAVCKRFSYLVRRASKPTKNLSSFITLKRCRFNVRKILQSGSYSDEEYRQLLNYRMLIPDIYDFNIKIFRKYAKINRMLYNALISKDRPLIVILLNLDLRVQESLIVFAARTERIFFLEELFIRQKLTDFTLLYDFIEKHSVRNFLRRTDPNFLENFSNATLNFSI